MVETVGQRSSTVDVLLTRDGSAFITFDNWHSMGYGANVVVIYNRQGEVVSQRGLNQILPEWFVAAQPRSVSSIWWRGEPRLSDDGVDAVIPITIPSLDQEAGSEQSTLDLSIRLTDGEITNLSEGAWKAALDKAATVARRKCLNYLDDIAEWNAPIKAPSGSAESAWHRYLREIAYRSLPVSTDGGGPVVETTVLRHRSAPDVNQSIEWLSEALTAKASEPDQDIRLIGSPDPEWLVDQLETVAAKLKRDQLNGVGLIIVLDEPYASRATASLSQSGAKLRIVGSREEISQRTDRLQNLTASDLPICLAPQKID